MKRIQKFQSSLTHSLCINLNFFYSYIYYSFFFRTEDINIFLPFFSTTFISPNFFVMWFTSFSYIFYYYLSALKKTLISGIDALLKNLILVPSFKCMFDGNSEIFETSGRGTDHRPTVCDRRLITAQT